MPVTEIEMDCDFGHIITKAAVLRDYLDQRRHLLRNKTVAMFEESRKNKEIKVYTVNAVEIHAKRRFIERINLNTKTTANIIPEVNDDNLHSSNELDNILPLVEPKISKSRS